MISYYEIYYDYILNIFKDIGAIQMPGPQLRFLCMLKGLSFQHPSYGDGNGNGYGDGDGYGGIST